MSQTLSVTALDAKDRHVWVACAHCGKVTCHHVLTLIATSDQSPDGDAQIREDFMTIQCGGCKTVSFCTESTCSEEMAYNPQTEEDELAVRTRVYPNRIAGRTELEHAYVLPGVILRIYNETRTTLSGNQPVLGGIGIRVIVETVCKERGAKGKDLKEQIEDLIRLGAIAPAGAKILHSLRFMGNDAAHEVKAHTQDELSAAFDVAEFLLKGVYILPTLAGCLPQRRL